MSFFNVLDLIVKNTRNCLKNNVFPGLSVKLGDKIVAVSTRKYNHLIARLWKVLCDIHVLVLCGWLVLCCHWLSEWSLLFQIS